eukprot:15436606-Alexandrium_andersonii.AAC.1
MRLKAQVIPDRVFVAIDIRNAYGATKRRAALAAPREHAPSLAPLLQPTWDATSRAWIPGPAVAWQPVDVTD